MSTATIANGPIFEHFFIIGPKSFKNNCNPEFLYEYPDSGKSNELQLHKLLFNDNCPVYEEKIKKNEQIYLQITQLPQARNELLTLIHTTSWPYFVYTLRFYADPFNRPALVGNHQQILNEEIQYFANKRRTKRKMFAMCFVTTYPFHTLFYPLLKYIFDVELNARMASKNLDFNQTSFFSRKSAAIENFELVECWPLKAFEARKTFLEAIYSSPLPEFGETMNLLIDRRITFTWNMPKADQVKLQIPIWASYSLLSWIDFDVLIILISAMLTERSIGVFGSNIEEVMKIVIFLPYLVQPFDWVSTVLPIIDNIEIISSPTPGIYGYNIRELKNVEEDIIIINADTKEVLINQSIYQIPQYDVLKPSLQRLFEEMKDSKNQYSQSLEKILTEISSHLYRTIVTHFHEAQIEVYGEKRIDKSRLVSSFPDPIDAAFIKEFYDTMLFSYYSQTFVDQTTDKSLSEVEMLATHMKSMANWSLAIKNDGSRDKSVGMNDLLTSAIGRIKTGRKIERTPSTFEYK